MISFIIIGKNEDWRLKLCLESIINVVAKDNITNYELIYVDSKSTDDSLSIAKQYANKVFLITGVCNAAIARNIGAKEAIGDILFFIDGDMEIQSGFLSNVINENNELIYPFVSGVWNDKVYDTEWNYLYTIERAENAKDQVEQTTGGLFIINAELWEKVDGMDTRLKRHQDLDLGIRLTKLGRPLHRKKWLLAVHHTIAYNDRKVAVNYYKYTAVLLRKHVFSKYAIKLLIFNQYTTIALLISIILAMLVNVMYICMYLSILLYRSTKAVINQKKSLNTIFRVSLYNVKRDLTFLLSLFTFFPNKSELIYVKI